MTERLGWALVGASTVAPEWMIDAIRAQDGSDVVTAMSSSQERGAAFAREHNISRSYDTVDALLADPAVDVVYISTTNEMHLQHTLAAAAAGKHVLCEKPFALTLADASRMVDACAMAGVQMGTNHHLRNTARPSSPRRASSPICRAAASAPRSYRSCRSTVRATSTSPGSPRARRLPPARAAS